MREHWNPKDLILIKKKSRLERVSFIDKAVKSELFNDQSVYARTLKQINNTTADVFLPFSKQTVRVCMFGSNNYLGLAHDQRVIDAAKKALDQYGTSMCGSAFLNGNSILQKQLEQLTAVLKNAEDCLIFSAGFNANTAWTSTLLRPIDKVIFDEEAHMSFREGIRCTQTKGLKFLHNSIPDLDKALSDKTAGEKYVYTESLFSMTGDILDLANTQRICKKHNALLLIDEAHGTGTLGKSGRGLIEDLSDKSDVISIGTFSKALGSTGGFICGNRDFINFLRVTASQYMFSAALAPASIAAAIESIEILLNEPDRVNRLRENSLYASEELAHLMSTDEKRSPIKFISIGDRLDVMTAAKMLEIRGFFVNPISYPAVSKKNSGIRITLSSEHTRSEIHKLRIALDEVFGELIKE